MVWYGVVLCDRVWIACVEVNEECHLLRGYVISKNR